MIKTSIEKIAKDIGFDIGNSDDVVQADLLNGLASGLSKTDNSSNYDMQICYIAEKLTKESFRMISKLNDFIELKIEELKKL